ncbi:DNA-binding protein [Mesorhizobium sp. M3A.F.Ca.ET.080.04.2.1]|uniref:cold-shock protein n=1 Tax=Mesorhizobium sp. M3A.F.Ca.ET.080.04.2.1 TaxID=2493676 RepID=UPI000F74EBE3|nr:cold-shock protein [Mesorhizobium sp. M3A.F.Ca.ET.080.04.2.1]AZO07789.1 DNA-binding protein [Mesorhizobium sp. M3A.F.Ca.ET.080.04.2.1]RWF16570.1 MAG: DNA-binding protein [Mesorhizobium sp.]
MSKYRDHRDQGRRRDYGEDSRSSDRTSEPSYFQRRPVVAADPTTAEVVWFNANKGFGFVKLADGAEAYLHIRVLEAAGSGGVSDGTRLKVTIEETPRGRQVAQVLEVGEAVSKPSVHSGRAGAPSGSGSGTTSEGMVKWYNPDKGFGFIAPSDGGRDIFVHATALARSGLGGLAEGQKVLFESGQGKKGLEVQTIRLP